MNRRDFMKSSIAGLALSALPVSLLAGPEGSIRERFLAAVKKHPYLSGYQSANVAGYDGEVSFKGKLPPELVGTLYRNGPARHDIGDFRYQHWFDGDGMLQAYQFADGKLKHRARMIQTRKFQAEQAAGRPLYPGFGTHVDNPAPVTSPDMVNVGNISVLPHHGKLLALWEAGSPWEIDPDNLDTKGIYAFSKETHGVPFSAHPRVEPNGTLWNFGYLSSAGLLLFWHIDAKGNVVKMGKVKSEASGMPHDFIVTERHIVVLVAPYHFKPRNADSFLAGHEWRPDLPTRVLVMDKSDFSQYRWLELPAQWVFHYGNGYEDNAGVIRFDGVRAPDPSVMTKNFVDIMHGELSPPVYSQLHQYRIDTRNWSVTETPMLDQAIDAEFPAIDPRLSTKAYSRVVLLTSDEKTTAPHHQLNQVSRFDFDKSELVSFRYPDSQLIEEHIFVPAPGSQPESKGWVIGTAHDWQRQETLVNVFDYSALDAGPIASASLPYVMPLGLHGKFVPG